MDSAVRALVWRRAASRCEYCRLAQTDTPFRTFHIDHIVPRKHDGSEDPDNLALACDRCTVAVIVVELQERREPVSAELLPIIEQPNIGLVAKASVAGVSRNLLENADGHQSAHNLVRGRKRRSNQILHLLGADDWVLVEVLQDSMPIPRGAAEAFGD